MQAEQKTKNLQTKDNVNILSAMSKKQPIENEQLKSTPNFLSSTPPSSQNQGIRPGQKQQPVSVEKKVGRNEPCPCGSGKKYKKCHG